MVFLNICNKNFENYPQTAMQLDSFLIKLHD